MKYKLLLVVACIAFVYTAKAQELSFFSGDNGRLLDTALSTLRMNRSDIWMPWDAVEDDVHRLDIIKQLFGNPLRSFDVTTDYANRVRADVPRFLDSMLYTLQLERYQRQDYRNTMTAAEIDRKLGIGLDTLTGLVETVVLRQYLTALIEATDDIRRERTKLDSAALALVVQHADSVLLSSEESSKASVYELRAAEVEAEAVLKKFYIESTPQCLPTRVYNEGVALYAYYRMLLDRSLSLRDLYTDNIKTIVLKTRYGKIAIGGKGNDVYNDDFVFILDAGGDDTYLLPARTKAVAMSAPVRCIIDLGGNDTYRGGDFSLGGAFFGIDMLFDTDGNDVYNGGNFALGSGLFGIGIVEDFAGHDTYAGRTCTQGSGAFGIGMLIDRSGNDLYRCEQQAQGFGYVRGFGALADFKGNDSYLTMSPFQDFLRYDDHFVAFTQGAGLGSRPLASGGIGMLFDYQGSDTYFSDIFGQGTSYWFALGGLYDESGNDRYTAFQYAQGSAAHFCHGVLYDKSGNDHYYSHGVSQGCGHDVGFGGLVDDDGDDEYVAESLSMGGGNANAISLFIDQKGSDAYVARTPATMMGFSDLRRDYGMIGIFADGGGRDLYSDTVRNTSTSVQSTYGVFTDLNMFTTGTPQSDAPALTPPEDQRDPLASTLDSLFIQASAAPQKFQYNVTPARNAIIERGPAALPFLASKLATTAPRERHSLDFILEKLCEADTTGAVRTMLLDSLRSGNELVYSMCATALGKKKIADALPVFIGRLWHPNWRIRANAAMQIGKIGQPVAIDSLIDIVEQDKHPHVRMRAAYALGLIMPDSLFPLAQRILREDNQLVRNGFMTGLKQGADTLRASFLMHLIENTPNERPRLALADLASKAAFAPEDSAQYAVFIAAQPASVRRALYSAMSRNASDVWIKTAGSYRNSEPDETLRAMLPTVPERNAEGEKSQGKKKKDKKKENKKKREKTKSK